MVTFDKAGPAYWDGQWHGYALPEPIDPRKGGLNNFMVRRYHRLFSELLAPYRHTGASLIEVGCGGSNWLPYFAREYGFNISGIDYSSGGCALSLAIHAAEGEPCRIVQGDIFDPPLEMVGAFDVVYSHGLVEHFIPTEPIISAMTRLLKPGGFMLSIIPNLRFLPAALQKVIDRSIYDVHVPLSAEELRRAHEEAGLTVERCGYLGTVNFGVMNFSKRGDKWWAAPGQRLCSWASKAVWIFEGLGMPEIRNPITSPYSYCWETKPMSSNSTGI